MDVFGGAPRFLAYPRTFTVQNGADAVLKCQIAGDPRPSILWEKDRTPIEPSGRFHVEAKGNVYSLLVSRVTSEDSGLYICKAKNNVGETYAAAMLKVEAGEPLEEGDPENKPPVFLVRPSSMRVCRGEDVMFTCRVSGQPCPVLHWEKDGHELSDLFESSHFSVGKEPEDWHFLKLFGARPPDGGVYVCRARSGSREALAAAVLLVEPLAPGLPDEQSHESPGNGLEQPGEQQQCRRHAAGWSVAPEAWALPNGEVPAGVPGAKAFAVSAGKHAKFRCYVTGKPKPEIVWKKDGKPITPGRRHLVYEDREGYFILKVLYCKPQDQGLYICTASNTAGQTLSAVQLQVKEHRVRFQVQLADVEVQEREDAVLECHVPLETIPTSWYLEDKELQPSHKYVMEEQGVVRRLTIRDAHTDDDGIYLCQMKDKGRSIAEVSVRGMIIKRLPRKLDVMEGENAAFCVETREAVEGICWSRNGQELQESSHTVLKSFGRTHLLVLVHVTREEAGIISFAVGESQTTSQLRVKCVKRDPPSTPVAARMSTEHSNAALLTWCPAPDVHHRPPSSYVLERQEVSSSEWVHCLTTDLASLVEVLGDSVPCEADYRFRICAVNKYGRSGPVEFPGSVHLVPAARLERGLQDARVRDGEDAHFSLELSASVRGAWFLNGARLDNEEGAGGRYCMQHCKTEHSLLIRGARLAESGAQVVFVSSGIRDSATLHVQEPLVRIVSSNEDAPHAYAAQERVVLWCELSRADAPVCWYKDGLEVEVGESLVLEREGPRCRLVLPCAWPQDAGEFVCDAGGDSVFYNITVAEPPVRIISSNEDAPHAYEAQERVVLWCELSRADAPVHWYKDGLEVEVGESLVLEREGPRCRLVLPCARLQDTGEFVCDAGGDSVFYNIMVAAPQAHIAPVPEAQCCRTLLAGQPLLLECEVSPPGAPVRWLKDREAVVPAEALTIQSEGCTRRLLVCSAGPSEAGTYTCEAGDTAVSFVVTVSEPPVRIVSSNEDAPHAYEAQEHVVLWCELSRADAPVHWYKDGLEVEVGESLVLEREGPRCQLVLPCARLQDTGEFVCDAGDTSASYSVTVAEPRVRILHPLQRSLALPVLALARVALRCELSVPDAPVRWFKDGLEVDESDNLLLLAEGAQRCLVIRKASVKDAGEYICESRDEAVSFDVQVSEPPVKILQPRRPPPVVKASPGETVTLACELSRADAPVRWAKEGIRLEAGGSLVLEEEGAHRRLLIPAARAEHSGKYVCDTDDDVVTFTVQVSDPLVRIQERDALLTRRHCRALEDLVLEVHLSHAHGEVKWYKDGEKLQDTGRVRLEEDGARRSLVVLGATRRDAGEYLCDTRDDSVIFCITVEVPRVVEIIAELHSLTVLEGEDAVFKCVVSPKDVALTWQLNGQAVAPCERLVVVRTGLCHSLTIRQCQLADAATVTANAEGLVSVARLSVQEAQVLFVRRLRDVAAEEQQDVSLEVEVSHEAAEVQWMKQGVLLQPGGKYQLQESGRRRTLTIRGLSPSDRGTYRCESLHDRTQAKLCVEPRKVSIQTPLADVETFEKETATFHLELSHAGVPGVWTRDGIRVKPSRMCCISAMGCVHSLTLQRLTLEDSGTVAFTADTLRCSARLLVREPPVAMVKVLQDLGVPEMGAASFECELSRPTAEVKWYKDGMELRPGPHCRIYSAGRRRLLQFSRCELADAGVYTCDAGDCQASATLHVHERQVCIVQELQDACVRENENAVFTCEVSDGDVKGEWFRDGEKIKVTSMVKIRQEGERHFLLICAVRPEDAGLIRFAAKMAISEANLQVEALPIRIVKPLRDKTVLARHKATLECTVSHARGRVRWFRGDTEIFTGDKYEICNLDCYRTLIIHHVGPEDEDSYTCDAFDDCSTARLLVEGE
ncbi:OBSL1 protein, partial [Dromaius novaehollandiae]|nr:OBSL1 protein [Dromaius novaehollandiae]